LGRNGDRCRVTGQEHLLLPVLTFPEPAISEEDTLDIAAGGEFDADRQGLVLSHDRRIHAQDDRTHLSLSREGSRTDHTNNGYKRNKRAIHEGSPVIIIEGDKERRKDRLIEKQTAGLSTCRQCIKTSYEKQ
jgi:hypothetical protein